MDGNTIQINQSSASSAKRKVTVLNFAEQDIDAVTKKAINKQDRLDHSYIPNGEDGPAAKKSKSSRKQEDPSKLYPTDAYSPPEKGKHQSRKNWTIIHCRRTLKLMPDPRTASAAEILVAYERSKALNEFMQGEFEYQSNVASDLRRKGTRDLQAARVKIEELEVAVGVMGPVRSSSKKQKAESQMPSPTKVVQPNSTHQSRFESISTNLAFEVSNLKMQLEMEKHDAKIEALAKHNAEQQLEAARLQIKQLQETAEQPLAALRVEVGHQREEREQAECQLKEALSDRNKAEAEILTLRKEIEERVERVRAQYTNVYQKVGSDNQEMKEKLAKQEQDIEAKDKEIKEQQQAFTRAMACFRPG